MSVTLNHSDFQCLQDQLVDLKTKNYELAEKNRRCQADFEAAKAKICALQLNLEEQERDFELTSATLRREIEAVAVASRVGNVNKDPDEEEDYKAKYKKLLHKAKEIQLRHDKSEENVQQLVVQNKSNLTQIKKLEDENSSLKEEVEKLNAQLLTATQKLTDELEEHKIQERKGLQMVKELKRQLALEKFRIEALKERLKSLLREALASIETPESTVNNQTQLSHRSSVDENSSRSSEETTSSNSEENNNSSSSNSDDTISNKEEEDPNSSKQTLTLQARVELLKESLGDCPYTPTLGVNETQ